MLYKRVLLLAITITVFACNNPFDSDNDKSIGPILFRAIRDAKRQIYAMSEDGSNITQLHARI